MNLSKTEEERALDVHRKATIINCIDATMPANFNVGYLAKLKESNISGTHVAVQILPEHDGLIEVLETISSFSKQLDLTRDKMSLATKVEDIKDAKAKGKMAMIWSLQNAKPIDRNISLLEIFRRLGVRIFQPTYQMRNLLGDGVREKANAGLSIFGEKVVAEANRIGMLIDLSHCGEATTNDVIAASQNPVVVTHAGCRSLYNHVRNKTDEQIKALAGKGGVMGIYNSARLLNSKGGVEGGSIEMFLDHIDHVSELVGPDHVGIGLDMADGRTLDWVFKMYDNPELMGEIAIFPGLWEKIRAAKSWDEVVKYWYVEGLEDMSKVINITKGLVTRGYSDQEIEKILGGNFLRVFEEVWK